MLSARLLQVSCNASCAEKNLSVYSVYSVVPLNILRLWEAGRREVGVHFFTAKGTKNTKIHRANLVIDA